MIPEVIPAECRLIVRQIDPPTGPYAWQLLRRPFPGAEMATLAEGSEADEREAMLKAWPAIRERELSFSSRTARFERAENQLVFELKPMTGDPLQRGMCYAELDELLGWFLVDGHTKERLIVRCVSAQVFPRGMIMPNGLEHSWIVEDEAFVDGNVRSFVICSGDADTPLSARLHANESAIQLAHYYLCWNGTTATGVHLDDSDWRRLIENRANTTWGVR